jgi:hypothetical protein
MADCDAYSAFGHGGISHLLWGQSGLRLLFAEFGQPQQFIEARFLRMATTCSHLPLTGTEGPMEGGGEVHVLHADDRLLFVTESAAREQAEAWCAPDPASRFPFRFRPHLSGQAHALLGSSSTRALSTICHGYSGHECLSLALIVPHLPDSGALYVCLGCNCAQNQGGL